MDQSSRIYIAGHNGLVGSAIERHLEASGFHNLIHKRSAQCDLRSMTATAKLFAAEQPEYVFLAAAKVGGILANMNAPADFLHDNLEIALNVIQCAKSFQVKKLLFFGSSCIYPKFAEQPIKEEALLTGELEPTNEAYAIAKIAGIKLCQSYRKQYGLNAICCMPANLYGPNDNFDELDGHVIPALIRRFHNAKIAGTNTTVWGTCEACREFLHVDDLATAACFLMQRYDGPEIINIGTGENISIGLLSVRIKQAVGFAGEMYCDLSKPDGTPRKLLDSSRIHALGWHHKISLEEGLRSTYEWFLEHVA